MTAMFTGELGFLSNFDRTPFFVAMVGSEVVDRQARSGEHIFNAMKTLDAVERAQVLAAATPAEAKRLGRRVRLRPFWDEKLRVVVMREVLRSKFGYSSDLADRLLALPDSLELRETNTWHDQFWGDCVCPRHRAVSGRNMLGELLAERRADLLGEVFAYRGHTSLDECVAAGTHLRSCDGDGYCNSCGESPAGD